MSTGDSAAEALSGVLLNHVERSLTRYIMTSYKTGPLAYDCVLAFWVVALDFFVWMVVMSVAMFKAIGKDEQRLS